MQCILNSVWLPEKLQCTVNDENDVIRVYLSC